MEKHRVTLLRCIYSMYKSCHLECKMQDEYYNGLHKLLYIVIKMLHWELIKWLCASGTVRS